MAPPSAALEHGTLDVIGGVKPFTSAAADINIPQSLMLTCLVVFIIYNIALFFDVDLDAIANFGTTVCQTIVDCINMILNIVNSSGNWIKSTFRSNKNTSRTVRRADDPPIYGSVPNDTVHARLATPRHDLWNGTCVRTKKDIAHTSDISGITTPISESFASSTPDIDLALENSPSGVETVALDDLAPPSTLQRRSRSRQAI